MHSNIEHNDIYTDYNSVPSLQGYIELLYSAGTAIATRSQPSHPRRFFVVKHTHTNRHRLEYIE